MSDIVLGVHLSLGRKPVESLARASASGARAAQIFASSPGAWKAPIWQREQAEIVWRARTDHAIDPLFIHSIYLINLASENPDFLVRAKASLIATLHAGSMLRAAGVITHIGSHGGRGYEQVADQVAASLLEILAGSPGEIDLILENSAGSGGIIGSELQELGDLLSRCGWPARLRVALDTAHLCAAGWDFRAPGTTESLIEQVHTHIGLDRLVVLHANDSKVPCGSRRDRHAVVGDGYIGLDGFRALLLQPALRLLPWILETPDLGEGDPDARWVSFARLSALAAETGALMRAHSVG
ncbi:MAG: deoxyribonuclease IV [Chloroflexota bacterium]